MRGYGQKGDPWINEGLEDRQLPGLTGMYALISSRVADVADGDDEWVVPIEGV